MSEQTLTPEILTAVDKEKFRRKIAVVSKLIAVGLVLAIVWFGWVNYVYAKDINSYLSEYGSNGFCYMCGKEAMKRCDCQYNYAAYSENEINYTQISNDLALYNTQVCEMKDLAPQTNPLGNVNIEK